MCRRSPERLPGGVEAGDLRLELGRCPRARRRRPRSAPRRTTVWISGCCVNHLATCVVPLQALVRRLGRARAWPSPAQRAARARDRDAAPALALATILERRAPVRAWLSPTSATVDGRSRRARRTRTGRARPRTRAAGMASSARGPRRRAGGTIASQLAVHALMQDRATPRRSSAAARGLRRQAMSSGTSPALGQEVLDVAERGCGPASGTGRGRAAGARGERRAQHRRAAGAGRRHVADPDAVPVLVKGRVAQDDARLRLRLGCRADRPSGATAASLRSQRHSRLVGDGCTIAGSHGWYVRMTSVRSAPLVCPNRAP